MQIQDMNSRLAAVDASCCPLAQILATTLFPNQFFEHYQRKGVPVVVKGLVPLDPPWSLEYLCQQLGSHYFPLRCYGRDRYQHDKRTWTTIGSGVPLQSRSFSDFADMIRSGEAEEKDIYLGRCPLNKTPLATASTLVNAERRLGLQCPATPLNLWVGAGRHTACLHYDPMDSVIMQLYGEKHVILFPPSQLGSLYPFPVNVQLRRGLSMRPGYSQVYPNAPNFEAFPKLQVALPHRHEVVMRPGDVLLIPAGWWHEITTVGDGMVASVNRFWHVRPVSRSLTWNKWRIHLGSLLGAPHVLKTIISAAKSTNRRRELDKLLQKL